MDRANTSAARIAEADGLARTLYRRARLAGPDFSDIATVVRGLHTVLKHLRVEAEDPDSLLNATQQEHSVYARQLGPIVEDCEFTLKQLDTILEKYGGSSADTPSADGPPRDGYIAGTAESREKDMIALIRTKLANQKTNIDIFLDTVQLHNPATARTFVDNPQSQQLDSIKDKVDAIAARLARRRVATGGQNGPSEMQEEELWQQFCEELTREGFASDVLMRNKEVLRAYIREMDSNGLLDNDSPPSVRGLLLDQQQQPPMHAQRPSPLSRGPPMTVTPASYPHAPEGDLSPKEVVYPANMNEKFLPSVKLDRRPPDYSSAPPPLSHSNRGSPRSPQSPEIPPGPPSPSGSGTNPFQAQGQQHHRQHQSLQTYNPYVPHPQPQSQPSPHAQAQHSPPQPQGASPHTTSPQLLYHPVLYEPQSSGLSALERQPSVSDSTDSGSESSSSHNQPATISTRDLMQLDHREAERLASQMAAMRLNTNLPPPQYVSPGTSPKSATPRYLPAPPTMADQLGVSPRFAPALPPAYTSPAISNAMVTQVPPPAYGASPPMQATYQQLPRLASRLQPDSSGREIPLDATWTKIRRTLVSPEVLDRAGVRYEARPDFVAVLGELTKAEIAQYAHETLEVRRQRMGGSSYSDKRFQPPPHYARGHNRADGHFRDEKPRSGSTSDDESVLWDSSDYSSDDEKDRRNRSRRADSKSSSTLKTEKEKAEMKEKSSQDGSADGEEKGTKVYPFILPLSQPDNKNGDAKASPASTVSPKPILKNKNENHVRFDRKGPVEVSAEELAAEQRRRERKEKERAEREREREREQRDRDRRRRDRDRDPDRYRERERSRERERDRDHHRRHRYSNSGESSYRHSRGESNGGASSRDREEARREKKKAWGQTLGAAGIGGAAASLLSVLTEAASGF
ncbi:hypothetical protein RB595_001401 [Gaeumannomyces hyphopodioides]